MKLPELKKRFKNKFTVRIIAGVLTIAMVGGGVSAYTVYAEKAGDQKTQTESTDSKEDEEVSLSSLLKDNLSVSETNIGKDETVYLISDANGNVTKTIVSDHLINTDKKDTLTDKSDMTDIQNVKGDETFTQNGSDITWQADGNDIYYQGTSTKEAPVTQKVTYSLDGKEITPEELAGKSGKVTIRFDYTNNTKFTEKVNGEDVTVAVPLAAITGMVLDDSFSNIEVTNGKLTNSGTGNIVIGYALPGLKDSLDVDDDDFDEDVNIPEYFEVTADVENFSLDTAMTVVANAGNFISTDGTSDLSKVDDMIDELTDASQQLQDGSKELADGLDTLQDKLGEFSDGMDSLVSGLKAYTNGASAVNDGAGKLKDGIGQLAGNMPALVDGVDQLDTGAQAINAGIIKLDSALNTKMTKAEIEQLNQIVAKNVNDTFDNSMHAYIESEAMKALKGNSALSGVLTAGVEAEIRNLVVDKTVQQLGMKPYDLFVQKTGKENPTDAEIADLYYQTQGSSLTAETQKFVVDKTIEELNKKQMTAYEVLASQTETTDDTAITEKYYLSQKSSLSDAVDLARPSVVAKVVNKLKETPLDNSDMTAYEVLASQTGSTDDTTIAKAYYASQGSSLDVAVQSAQNEVAYGTVAEIKKKSDAGADSGYKDLAEKLKSIGLSNPTNDEIADLYYQTNGSSLQAEIKKQLDSNLEKTVGDIYTELSESVADTAQESAVVASQTTAQTVEEETKATIASQIEAKQANGQSLVTGAQALAAGMKDLKTKVPALTSGVTALVNGSSDLATGTKELISNNGDLNSGASKLKDGTAAVVDGVKQLDDGSHELADGMVKFDEEGIDKLVNAYTGDLKPFANKIQAMLDAGQDYQSYTDIADGVSGSVKFVYKLDSIKAAEEK